ncbi:hypothetical protein SASPL_147818 [Salvia splendens]|uniref:Omega-hydroxypalmitate O-feruloyl transferase n=1 Tax=Salvia splendens TaxID=180675 RepID=A0A8X8WFT9_SALSN|nr:alcohol acyltransferase 9 [Salvia splendens]KAG6393574.1 hypothetical protein SASPL_147818 [Salvia splendens]
MPSNVNVTETILITPSEPTPNHVLRLSALDSKLFARFVTDYMFVYEPRHGADQDAITENVKTALSRALVPYYPLAGTVRVRAEDPGLEVACTAQGAIFITATSTCTTPEFNSPPQHIMQWRSFLSHDVTDALSGAPLVIMQLTWLQDGGAVLAVAFNHCMIDGAGSSQFLNSVAGIAMGPVGPGSGPKPVWARHLLDPVRARGVEPVSLPECKIVPDVSGFEARFATEAFAATSTFFDVDKLREMKELLKPRRHTSFEVLAGHVWRSWARALGLAPEQRVRVLFSINVRERMRPGLPGGFYGNGVVHACAEASAGELAGNGLGFAAGLVAGAKEGVEEERVREVVESVSSKWEQVDFVGTLILTQWSRLGLEMVDFGLGRPVQVSPVCSGRFCTFLPVCGVENAVKVNLGVPVTALDQYLSFVTNISE